MALPRWWTVVVGVLGAVTLSAQSADPVTNRLQPFDGQSTSSTPFPVRQPVAAPRAGVPVMISMPPLSTVAMQVEGRTIIGYSREVDQPRAVIVSPDGPRVDGEFAQLTRIGGFYVWQTKVVSPGAKSVSLRLGSVRLPEGAALWVIGDSEVGGPYSANSVDTEGYITLPPIAGESLILQLEIAAVAGAEQKSVEFEIVSVQHYVTPSGAGGGPEIAATLPCDIDTSCALPALPALSNFRHGVALLYITFSDGSIGQCTGSLLNNTQNDGTPYLLSANHCFTGNPMSLVAFWDYYKPVCSGSTPPLSSLPYSSGGTILAQSAGSDYTFIRMNTAPTGRHFLGWDATSIYRPEDERLIRISHPQGAPQTFSIAAVRNSTASCGPYARPSFIYSEPLTGGADHGSSGSSLFTQDGMVVGQLHGPCGSVIDPCLLGTYTLFDGSFASEYSAIRQWLAPTAGSPSAPSNLRATVTGDTTANLAWNDNSSNETEFVAYYSTSGQSFQSFATAPAGSTSMGVTQLIPGIDYQFRITARNASGESQPSNVVSLRTGTTIPTAPSNLGLSLTGTTTGRLTWSDNSSNETDFVLYYSTNNGFVSFGSVGANQSQSDVTSLTPGAHYSFRVTARNSAGESSPSNVVSVDVPAIAPAAPTSLRFSNVSSNSVRLDWVDNSSDELAFVIYESSGSGFAKLQEATANTTFVTITGLAPLTPYSFRITARSNGAESAPSNTVQFSTPAAVVSPPSDLSATVASSTSIAVTWKDNSADEVSFVVYYAVGSGGEGFTHSVQFGANTTHAQIDNLTPGMKYSFRVTARTFTGESLPSNTVDVSLPGGKRRSARH